MIYGIIATLVTGVLIYIQYLRSQLAKHQIENFILRSQTQNKEWQDKINQSQTKITETEKDYEAARDSFHSKYGITKPGPSGQ